MAATKVKVIDLAKELGVTSKDLMLAAEEMGHKGVRAMTPLDAQLANDLRTKLGKGRELPEEPVKPKRVPKPKAPVDLGPDGTPLKKPTRVKKAKGAEGEEEAAVEIKPAATIVKPKPAEIAGQPPTIVPKLLRLPAMPPTEMPPKLTPWYPRSRPISRVRWPSPRTRW